MKKRMLALGLALLLALSLVPTASAATGEARQAAQELHEMGLFQGVGTNADGTPNFDLDRTMNRAEAVTMLVRLLGKEAEAKDGSWNIPFTDVASWAVPYVGYAYENGLTKGVSATAFGGTDTVTATQYLTFVLRALGYDSSADFKWDAAWELSDKLGFTSGQYKAGSDFLRGDAAIVSNSSLAVKLKDSSVTLRETLAEQQGPAKAWYSVDKEGQLWIETNLNTSGWKEYSVILHTVYSDGSNDFDANYDRNPGRSLKIDLQTVVHYTDGPDIAYVDCMIFDGGIDDVNQCMAAFEQNGWNYDKTVNSLPVAPKAQFRLENDILVSDSGESLKLVSLDFSRDEEKDLETITAVLDPAPAGKRHMSLNYVSAGHVFGTTDLSSSDGIVTGLQGVNRYADSTGTFYVVDCKYSIDANENILCSRTVSNGLDWTFEK